MKKKEKLILSDHLKFFISLLIVFSFLLFSGCKKVPINPNDNSAPTVTFKVNGPNGYSVQTSADHSNSSSQEPIEIMCIVEDPQGVKSIDIIISDPTVDVAYCYGSLYPGNHLVAGLPSPISDILTGDSSGKVPTKISGIITIPGILELANIPQGETQTCYPANNTKIVVKCKGTNWSNNVGTAKTTKYFDVNFKF